MKIRRYGFNEDGFMRLQKDIDALINNRNLDHTHVGRLYTEYCDIRSAAGETVIDGPMLKMYDKQVTPVKRLQMGYNSIDSDFNFTMYNKNGNATIYLNSSGEAVFAGNIETGKNAYIGNDLYIGSTGTGSVSKAIRLRTDAHDIVIRGYVLNSTANIGIGLLTSSNTSTEAMEYLNGTMYIYGGVNLLSNGVGNNGNLIVGGKFGCNGALSQVSYPVGSALSTAPYGTTELSSPVALTDELAETNVLVNQIRTALRNNGICV
jgi:hypothetical protein